MKNISTATAGIPIAILAIVLTACTLQASGVTSAPSTPLSAHTPTAATFGNPFTYCAAIGMVDSPDSRYAGPAVPDEVINAFKKAAGLHSSTEPMDMLRRTTIWRCMDGRVYACNFGANLPCDSKADTDRTPSQAMADYCAANRGANFIPMSVTGHATIYSWRCVNGSPELLAQIGKVDAAGYLEQIWYPLEPIP